MAFSFGSSPAFGFSASQPASTPLFGAPASAPAFGAAPPAFGAAAPAASTPAPASAGAFSFGGAPAASPAFGAASTPAFGAASSAAFSFAGASPAAPFSFQPATTPATAAAQRPWGAATAPAPAPQQSVTYSTRFEELSDAERAVLEQIQEQISKYEADRVRVTHRAHLTDASGLRTGLAAETGVLHSELQALQGVLRGQQEALEDFRLNSIKLLRATEGVLRTYARSKLWREAPSRFKGQILPPAMQELLASPVQLPSPFLEEAVAGFQDSVSEYTHTLGQLEGALAAAAQPGGSAAWDYELQLTQALPTIVSNIHEYFIHVAAKLEKVNSQVARARTAHVARLRAAGIPRDPFDAMQRAAAPLESRLVAAAPSWITPPPPVLLGGAAAAAPATPPQSAPPASPGGMFSAPALPALGAAVGAANPFGGAAGGLSFGSPFGGTAAAGATGGAAAGGSGMFGASSSPGSNSLARSASRGPRSSRKR